jgi:transposase-like protein
MSTSTRPARPPFCPNPACPHHHSTDGWRWKKIGFFRRSRPPRTVQRYLCLRCRRAFSDQTFSVSYWLKRPELLATVFLRVLSCSSYRQIAVELGVSPSTTLRHTERLGRHCLLFQELFRSRARLREPLVIDGFETFEYSQYFPFHLNLAVGKDSHFFYAFTDAELRRKGSMTPCQKQRRQELESRLGRPDPKAVEKEVAALLELVPAGPGETVVHSDDHRAYPRAMRRLPARRFRHRVTSSKARRNARNPLFAVNWLDLLIRHGSSNHKRETIAFSKRRQNAAEKLAILQVWRNFIRRLTMKRKEPPPAVRLGLIDRALTVADVLARRLFPSRVRLPGRLAVYYRRESGTRMIPAGTKHELVYAF